MTATAPVVVLPQNGEEPLRGIVTATIGAAQAQARFGVANSKIQCSGEYPFTPGQGTVNVSTTCSDGRTGSGTAVRTSAAGGRGTMHMSDGVQAIFAYGPEAASAVAAPADVPHPPATIERSRTLAAPTRISPQFDVIVLKWRDCALRAATALVGQPESAAIIASAALGSCGPEQEDVKRAADGILDQRELDEIKTQSLMPRIIAQVLAIRAAREKAKQYRPEPTPVPRENYNKT